MIAAKTALLLALARGEGFGLQLICRVSDLTRGVITLKQGSIYPALLALEKDGFVTSWEEPREPGFGGRPRLVYKLTAKGKKQVAKERKAIRALIDGLWGYD